MYYIIITQKYFDICNQYYLHCTNLYFRNDEDSPQLNTLSESQIKQSWSMFNLVWNCYNYYWKLLFHKSTLVCTKLMFILLAEVIGWYVMSKVDGRSLFKDCTMFGRFCTKDWHSLGIGHVLKVPVHNPIPFQLF